MLLLTNTTDKLQIVTSGAADVDVHSSYMDASQANPPVVQGDTSGRQHATITTATTTDIVAAPGSGDTRNVKTIHIRNTHASVPTDVTVLYNANSTVYELYKTTLDAGEMCEYTEATGWFDIPPAAKLDKYLRVTGAVTNSTTSFADITGLTTAVESGKHYYINAFIIFQSAATTTGGRFGVGGVALTAGRVGAFQTMTPNATAAASISTGTATAVDTAVLAQTTGPGTTDSPMSFQGWVNPSASGTFALRVASEVGSSAVTVQTGSWLHIREFDN